MGNCGYCDYNFITPKIPKEAAGFPQCPRCTAILPIWISSQSEGERTQKEIQEEGSILEQPGPILKTPEKIQKGSNILEPDPIQKMKDH